MFEIFKDKFSTPEKRLKEFRDTRNLSLMFLLIGIIYGGKTAYYGIENKVISFEDGLTYKVLTNGRSQIVTEIDNILHSSRSWNIDERSNHICRDSFHTQQFIGKDVKFLAYYKEYDFLNYRYQGVILSGTFVNKWDNKVYKVKTTEKELQSIKYLYWGQILFIRFWLWASLIGFIGSTIAITKEKSIDE